MIYTVSAESGYQSVFQPGEDGINWLGLEILLLEAGNTWEGSLTDQEAALIILGGRCSISVNDEHWENLGARSDIFSGLATTVYAPRRSQIAVKGESRVEVAIAKSPCDVDLSPTLLKPDTVRVVSSGMSNWRRDVRLVIPPGSPISQRLIIGETINPPGNWSGIPPHKHDINSDVENFLEEFYLFKIKPLDGFGVQLIYQDGKGKGHIIGHNDVATFLNGYHPTVASPGTTIGYLWTLAGDDKAYDISIDPRFGWVATAEAILREEQRG